MCEQLRVCLISRYGYSVDTKKDVQRINNRMVRFADSHPDICGVFDVGETGEESITFNISWTSLLAKRLF